MELVDSNIYRYNNSIEQELEPTEVDDFSGVSWPHSEMRKYIKIYFKTLSKLIELKI